MRIQNVDETIATSLDLGPTRGAFISGTDPKGPASAAGIQMEDVIVKFDGQDVRESRDLPKIVAQEPVGKEVAVVLMRKGKELTKTVRLGLLEDGEQHAALDTKSRSDAAKPTALPSAVRKALGMTFSGLTNETRQKFTINESVASGVVISEVEPNSAAAEKRLQPGEVVVEINQEPVKQPSDVEDKFSTLKTDGKHSALLLVANARGEVRFVAVPVQ